MATTVGLLHPGAMGASVGAAAAQVGARVIWCSQGRSDATRARASLIPVEDVGSLGRLLDESDVVLSVCPPGAALELAGQVAELGYAGTYVDANAISPETARRAAARFASPRTRFVDGGLVGPPAHRAGTTRLYLSGDGCEAVAELFAGSALEAIAMRGDAGAASALKMAYASWTKGTSALLVSIFALARASRVEEELLGEWRRSVPDLPKRLELTAAAVGPKAWRFEDEMREISAAFEEAGLPGDFHSAAAEIYRRLAGLKDAEAPASADEVARLLLEPDG